MRNRTFACALLLAGAASAEVYTTVPIPGSNNIQTALLSTVPTGNFIANNSLATPFNISGAAGTCGPSGSSPCNFYDGFGFSGSGQSITINVSIPSPTDVYTLMNAYDPQGGQQLATITFVGTGGTSLTFSLVGGENIRDFYQGSFTNLLSNGVAGAAAINAFTCQDPANCVGAGGTGNVQTGLQGTYVLDEQDFSLGTTFAGQTLTQIIITDTYNGSDPILLGVTVGTASAGTPSIGVGGVITASGFGGFPSIAPGTFIEIYGTNLAADTRGWLGSDFTGINAPTSLDGTSVSIANLPAFISYISPGQVNALVPSGVAPGPQPLIVTTTVGVSNVYTVNVNAVEPGLLAIPLFDVGGIQYTGALNLDGTYTFPVGAVPGIQSRPATPGDYIVLYGIGFGPVTPTIPAGQLVQEGNNLTTTFQVSIGGVPALVSYDGLAPSYTGLYQFNVQVPDVPAGNAVPLTFNVGNTAGAQTLYIAVQN
jgi:uncharacterized protein (TIGR03437 family)